MNAANIRFLVLVVDLLRLSPHCFERSDKGVGVKGMAGAEPGVGSGIGGRGAAGYAGGWVGPGIDAAESIVIPILALLSLYSLGLV